MVVKSIATRLPFEVFDLINEFLLEKERATCMTVCLHWYLVFKQFLFKDIIISDYKQFRLLYRVINQEFDTEDDIGSHVKSIHFEPSAITLKNYDEYERFHHKMARLSILCPNISSITLPFYRITQECLLEDEQHEIISLLSHFSLSHLSVTSLQPFRLSDWPYLQHAQLTWANGSLDVNYLEQLHTDCPKLSTLQISARHVFLDFRPCQLSPSQLLELTIASQHYMDGIESVFAYAACKYPSLHKLNVQSSSATSLKSDLEEEQEENDIGMHLLNKYSAYTAFVQKCRFIDTLEFKNIVPDTVLLDAMGTMRVKIKRFKMDTIFGMSRSVFELMIRTLHESVTDLCVNTSLRIRGVFESMLATCKQLTRLELGKQPVVFVDSVLEHCPNLHRLVFYDTCVRVKQKHVASHARLRELVLDKVTFAQDVVDQITCQCPRLTALKMVNSIYLTEDGAQLQLMLSAHVGIEKLYLNARNREVIYYAVTDNPSEWYKMEGGKAIVVDEADEFRTITLNCGPNVHVYLANCKIN